MALPHSPLSRACRAVADLVAEQLQASNRSIRVLLGAPADAAPKEADTDHRINLFFYRVEPGGGHPDAGVGDPWWLRLHCLITVFAAPEGQVSAGENDLRLLGEVLRLFHERPVLPALVVAGEGEEEGETVELRALFQPLDMDQINHLWSTQGEVSYRPSLAYEMALLPVLPSRRRMEAPPVAATGISARPLAGAAVAPRVRRPLVPRVEVDLRRDDWTPHICLVEEGACEYSASMVAGSERADEFRPQVWIAGAEGAEVSLVWEKWTEEGWMRYRRDLDTVAGGPLIDPERAAEAPTVAMFMPLRKSAAQLVLYAERHYQPEGGAERVLRSNPVLVNLYEEAS